MHPSPKTLRDLLPIVDQVHIEEEPSPLGEMHFLDLPPEQPRPSFGLLGGEGDNREVRRVLLELEAALRNADHLVIPLFDLESAERQLLDELLGEGEVRGVVFTDAGEHRIRETVLPGVWRVQTTEPGGRTISDVLEVADVPQVVREANQARTSSELVIPEQAPEGAMNALPMLTEIQSKMLEPFGEHNHVISFTNMPVTPTDMELLERVIGAGPLVCESKGYGTCRVQLTSKRNVWSVQHMNAMGTVILDTIEVGDVPVALLAAHEDFEDSATRIRELLEDA